MNPNYEDQIIQINKNMKKLCLKTKESYQKQIPFKISNETNSTQFSMKKNAKKMNEVNINQKLLQKNIFKTNINNKETLKLQTDEFSFKDYEVSVIRKLISTNYCDVYKGEDKKKNFIALKRFKILDNDQNNLKNFKNELSCLKRLINDERVCRLKAYSEIDKNKNYVSVLAMELGEKTLFDTLNGGKNEKSYSMSDIYFFCTEMILIFSSFQKIGFYHRDIKPSNIIINTQNPIDKTITTNYKVIDFDVSIFLEDFFKSNKNMDLAGTPLYFSPYYYKL